VAWFPFYARGARNTAGQMVATGTGKFYPITDPGGTGTALVTRAITYPPAVRGTGAVLTNLVVADYATPDFEAEAEEGWWKSGSAPAIYLVSAEGMRTQMAAAQTAISTALAEATASRAGAIGAVMQNANGSWPTRPTGYAWVEWQRVTTTGADPTGALPVDYVLDPQA
jgi:hypothetical protein